MGYAQPTASVTEHGIKLRQKIDFGGYGLNRNAKPGGHLFLRRLFIGDKLVQGRVK
jgi:hypothetical protein